MPIPKRAEPTADIILAEFVLACLVHPCDVLVPFLVLALECGLVEPLQDVRQIGRVGEEVDAIRTAELDDMNVF